MKICRRLALILLVLIPILACASEPLTGKWEGSIATSRRPIVFQIVMSDQGKGTFEALGRRRPIEAFVGDGTVKFSFLDSSSDATFEGQLSGETISGTIDADGQPATYSLEREPVLPNAKDRAEAWQQDLDVAERKLMKWDRSFSPQAREQFHAAVAQLRVRTAALSDAQIKVGLARAVALAGNAHTRLYLLRNRPALRRIPVAPNRARSVAGISNHRR